MDDTLPSNITPPSQPPQAQPQVPSTPTPTPPAPIQTPPQILTQQPVAPEPEVPKPKSKLKLILIVIAVLVFLGVVFFGFLLFQGVKDAPQVQYKVTSFMQNVSDGNLESAYGLASKEFKQTTSLTEFEKSVSLYKHQYSDFQKQDQTGFSVESQSGQPTLYQYTGIITYTDGDQGDIDATLVKEAGEYKIQYIEVIR
jgi:uncharacterized protein HemX